MTQLAIFLLSKGVVDRVAVTKFVYTEQGPRTKTFLTTSVDEIMASQGSKYCPVDISLFLKDLDAFEGSVAYI
jgi:coenzyme F420-reducing hydrogenase beta subunit